MNNKALFYNNFLRRFLIISFLMAFSVSAFCKESGSYWRKDYQQADSFDLSAGVDLSILGFVEPQFEVRSDLFDYKFGLGALIFPVFDTSDLSFIGISESLEIDSIIFAKHEIGVKKYISNLGFYIGGGSAFLSSFITDFKSYFRFTETIGLYVKYGYTFPFGLELGLKNYLPLFGACVQGDNTTYRSIFDSGAPLYFFAAGLAAFTVEVKYHF